MTLDGLGAPITDLIAPCAGSVIAPETHCASARGAVHVCRARTGPSSVAGGSTRARTATGLPLAATFGATNSSTPVVGNAHRASIATRCRSSRWAARLAIFAACSTGFDASAVLGAIQMLAASIRGTARNVTAGLAQAATIRVTPVVTGCRNAHRTGSTRWNRATLRTTHRAAGAADRTNWRGSTAANCPRRTGIAATRLACFSATSTAAVRARAPISAATGARRNTGIPDATTTRTARVALTAVCSRFTADCTEIVLARQGVGVAAVVGAATLPRSATIRIIGARSRGVRATGCRGYRRTASTDARGRRSTARIGTGHCAGSAARRDEPGRARPPRGSRRSLLGIVFGRTTSIDGNCRRKTHQHDESCKPAAR